MSQDMSQQPTTRPAQEPAHLDEERLEVTRTVRIAAPRAVVWAALTEPTQIAQWFGQRASFPDGVRVGSLGSFGWTDHGDYPVRIDRYDPMTHFDFTWGTPGEEVREDNSTTAHFEVSEDGGQTTVTVTETGFATLGDQARVRAAMEDNRQGWTAELDELVEYVEGLVRNDPAQADVDAGNVQSMRV